jgi:tetratricopeptide (TPR) repeat protein
MRVLFTVLLIATAATTWGQSLNQKRNQSNQSNQVQQAPQQPLSPMSQHNARKYATANRWNDIDVARNALYDLILENPSNDSLIVTLAYIYFDAQKYASSLLMAQDLLVRDAKNPVYLELAAVSAQELGISDRALQHYEALYLINSNILTLYQIAFLQFTLKRLTESQASADLILGKPESNTTKVVFNDAQGKPKEYPMKVAILNLKGLIALEKADKAAAKKSFNEALAAAPDFLPAKENLEKTK